MPSKPESRLWKQLRDGTKEQVLWTRIESWAAPGVPDLHGLLDGTPFWLELKVHRLKTLKSVKFRPHQISWQTQYGWTSPREDYQFIFRRTGHGPCWINH
jgi:hypothetical protein